MKINEFNAIVTEDAVVNKDTIKKFKKMDDYIHYFRQTSRDNATDMDINIPYDEIYQMLRFAAELGGNISKVDVKKEDISFTISFKNLNDLIQFCSDLEITVRKNTGYF